MMELVYFQGLVPLHQFRIRQLRFSRFARYAVQRSYNLKSSDLLSFAAPFRFIIGIVSIEKMDEEVAKRGILDGEENLDIVAEVIQEYGERFHQGGRGRTS